MTDTSAKKKQTIELSKLAHVKILLHGVKNPRSPTHGILIGKFSSNQTLVISDVLPVCHSSPTKPLLEMALRLAEAHLGQQNDDCLMVGWYTSNDRIEDIHPKSAALRTMNAIHERFTPLGDIEPVLAFLSNSGLSSLLDCDDQNEDEFSESALCFYRRDSQMNWTNLIAQDCLKVTGGTWRGNATAVKATIVAERKKLELFDFENHIDSSISHIKEKDWLSNMSIQKFVNSKD